MFQGVNLLGCVFPYRQSYICCNPIHKSCRMLVVNESQLPDLQSIANCIGVFVNTETTSNDKIDTHLRQQTVHLSTVELI